MKFGEKHLSKPGPQAGIKKRKFMDLKEQVVKDRLASKPTFKTLNGIKSMFQYICKENGEVLWRRLPCFCKTCNDLEWEQCYNKDVVGKLKVVIKAGIEF